MIAALVLGAPACGRLEQLADPSAATPAGEGVPALAVDHNAAALLPESVVFSPRFAVLVNPPHPADAARLRAAGGGARALEWALDGMVADDPTAGRQTYAGLIETFRQAGLSEETARQLAQTAVDRGEAEAGNGGCGVVLPDAVREKAPSPGCR